jgi:hypothetical protein
MDTVEGDPNRPRSLSDMAGVTDWGRFHALVKRPDPSHIVLVGGAGIGKSCATRLCLGPDVALWLRCSQDPTLRDSRDKIKATARRRTESGKIIWIVLEHADLLHIDAQAFLRRVIETSLGSFRFILEVRDASAITEPLLSRTVLFPAPQLMTHEIRTEIMRRAPATSLDVAERLAAQCGGNIRWAILQGLGGSDGFIDESVPECDGSWSSVLETMEGLQMTGTNPSAWVGSGSSIWERPGGACPWALTAWALAQK